MNGTLMMMRPQAAQEIAALTDQALRTGVAPPKAPPRVVNLPGRLLPDIVQADDMLPPNYKAGPLGVIQVDGPMWYSVAPWSGLIAGGSIGSMIRSLDQFAADATVKAIILDINSPGGEACPLADMAEAVRRARAIKPVHARCYNTFSMGYAAACLADSISVSATAMVGAIGSLVWMFDESERFRQDGVRVLAASSAARKVKYAPGQELGDEEQAELQRQVDVCGDAFYALVEEGRGVPAATVRAMQGAEFFGPEAKAAGLVDFVESEHAFYERVMAGVVSKDPLRRASPATSPVGNGGGPKVGGGTPPAPREDTRPRRVASASTAGSAARHIKGGRMSTNANKGGVTNTTAAELLDKIRNSGEFEEEMVAKIAGMMDEEEPTGAAEAEEPTASVARIGPVGQAATFAQLDQIVPPELENRESLINELQRAQATVLTAQARVQGAVLKAYNEMKAQASTAQATAQQTAGYPAGRQPVKGANKAGAAVSTNARAAFENAVSEAVKAGLKRPEAVAKVSRENPDLHERYIKEVNAGRQAQTA